MSEMILFGCDLGQAAPLKPFKIESTYIYFSKMDNYMLLF